MARQWTIGMKIALGFVVTVSMAICISVIAVYALKTAVASKDEIIQVYGQSLVSVEKLSSAEARKVAAIRGFLLDAKDSFISDINNEDRNLEVIVGELQSRLSTAESKRLVAEIDRSLDEYRLVTNQVLELKKSGGSPEQIIATFTEKLVPRREIQAKSIQSLLAYVEQARSAAVQASNDAASQAGSFLIIVAVLLIVVAIVIGTILTRGLTRQVSSAIQQVQSSSTELQAAANQQAAASTEQATAMNEITTTISELLATSRQIADSAQRVAQIGEQTSRSAGTGELTMEKAHETFLGIRQQMDLIVNHMLDLGKKSQQIGTILEIVAELAEQTNILAINATIEAAGAGESGKRFAVVADEIRKLADRVARSTKEIRELIDDVRSAVNTTVMATETGSKAVDSGSRQFGDAASSFKQIAGLVGTTSEACREIELSTKQQTTAVEQVNVAITNVSQATKETEASSGQTFQTASQLASLSNALLQMVKSKH